MCEFVDGRSHVAHKTSTKHVARLKTDGLRTGVQLPPPPPSKNKKATRQVAFLF